MLAHCARLTHGATELLTAFALHTCGKAGTRLAREAGVPISPDTLLHVLHALVDQCEQRGPNVLGVDDVALRERRNAAMARCCSIWKRIPRAELKVVAGKTPPRLRLCVDRGEAFARGEIANNCWNPSGS